MRSKIVIGLSGGMDSATLLGLLFQQDYEVHCISFVYGSKHNDYEIEASKHIIKHYTDRNQPVTHQIIDVSAIFSSFDSVLLKGQGKIPEGHYEDVAMKATVVPGRNLIFASIMAGIAESMNAKTIALGVHSGDHHIYPDCRPEFIESLKITIQASSDNTIIVTAPLLRKNKTDILRIGLSHSAPYHLTRTCYKEQELSCGKCGSCVERLEAFSTVGLKDPIEYEN